MEARSTMNQFNFALVFKLYLFDNAVEIIAKCHFTNGLLNYTLIYGVDLLHQLGISFNFEKKTITGKEVSISIKPPDYPAKDFFVIKESCPVQNITKKIK